MAKYVITLEDAEIGTLIDVQQDDSVSDIPGNQGARHIVLGLMVSSNALLSVGRALTRHDDIQPIHRSTKVH